MLRQAVAVALVALPILIGVVVMTTTLFSAGARRARRASSAAGPRRRRRGVMPIEELASELRRLLREHDRLLRDPSGARGGRRLLTVEALLHERVQDASRALGLPLRPVGIAPSRTRQDLVVRLRRLAAAGLVLPDDVFLRSRSI